MDKKIIYGILIIGIVAILGVSFVAANGFNYFKDKDKNGNFTRDGNWTGKNLTAEQKLEIQQMRNFSISVETAIKNNDFTAWKTLMESQITQENFNKIVARQNGTYKMRPPMMGIYGEGIGRGKMMKGFKPGFQKGNHGNKTLINSTQ